MLNDLKRYFHHNNFRTKEQKEAVRQGMILSKEITIAQLEFASSFLLNCIYASTIEVVDLNIICTYSTKKLHMGTVAFVNSIFFSAGFQF